MDENLLNVLRLNVNVFDFLGHNVFALTKLEDVFLSVDDLQSSVRKPFADVAGVMPAVGVDGCDCSFRIFEISTRSSIRKTVK